MKANNGLTGVQFVIPGCERINRDNKLTSGKPQRDVSTLALFAAEEPAPIEPNGLFRVWSPDQVAECLDGIGELYAKLWDVVADYDNKPRSEVNDDFADRCLAKYWDRFTREEQAAFNAAAERHDAEMAKYRK